MTIEQQLSALIERRSRRHGAISMEDGDRLVGWVREAANMLHSFPHNCTHHPHLICPACEAVKTLERMEREL